MTKKFKFRFCVLIWASLSLVQAGPVDRYLRIVREVYPEIEPEKSDGSQKQVCVVGDVVYTSDEAVPSEQPCLKCKCQPPGVHCETTRCQKKPGCRAIHKPNECCPEYQCECEYEGKVYGNGERLETKPGGECQVCYCRGGEVQCTDVSCYIRTDCEGRRVPGQCCPKYEHCPPIEPIQEKVKSDVYTSTTTQISSEFTGNISSENEISDSSSDFSHKLKTTPIVNDNVTPVPSEPIETVHPQKDEEPKITIHEIIPELKEISVTESSKVESTTKVRGQLLVEEKVTNSENLVESNPIDSKVAESELSEVFEHPPPFIKIGDNILYLQKDEIDIIDNNGTVSPLIITNSPQILNESERPEGHVIKKEIKDTTEIPVDNVTIDVAVELPESIDIDAEGSENEPVRVESTSTTAKIEKAEKHKVDDVVLENPAYPPIPEIMVQQDAEYEHPEIIDIHEEMATETAKILPDILEIRNNNSIPENTTNESWLKVRPLINEEAVLPEAILRQVAVSDLDQTTNANLVTTLNSISTRIGTPKAVPIGSESIRFHSDDLIKQAVFESENHVKKITDDEDITGSRDDFVNLKKSVESIEQNSSESGENTTPKSVSEMISENASIETIPDLVENPDVEIINPELLKSNKSNITHEETGKENRFSSTLTPLLTTTSENDKIFGELDTELKVLSGDYILISTEKSKDEKVFKELLDEINTNKKTPTVESKDPIQRATNKLANLKLRDARQSLDVSVIGAVRDLFSAQYRAYAKKK